MKYLPIISFWALGIIWGSNFIYMKLASNHISPLQIVFFRVLFGFVPVVIYAYASRVLKRDHLKHSKHFVVMALLATVIYYFGFAKGASLLLSGVAGALSGAIPIFSFIFAMFFLSEERITKIKVLGVVVGFLGILLTARPFEQDLSSTNTEGFMYMILGSLSVGASFVYAKNFITPLQIPTAALTSCQLGLGLLILLFISLSMSALH